MQNAKGSLHLPPKALVALGFLSCGMVGRKSVAYPGPERCEQRDERPAAETQVRLLPDLDPNTRSMRAIRPNPVALAQAKSPPYFAQPIPKKIHLIWFRDREKMALGKVELWRQFARQFSYTFNLWSEVDDAVYAEIMPAQNYGLLKRLLATKSYHAGSDLVRIHLLKSFGGVYSDVDIAPPQAEGGHLVDLADIAPMSNCLFMTENHGREVGNGAIFVMNGFMASCVDHPIFSELEKSVFLNATNFAKERPDVVREPPYFGAPYTTGPFLLNQSLAGVIQLLPISTGYSWQMIE